MIVPTHRRGPTDIAYVASLGVNKQVILPIWYHYLTVPTSDVFLPEEMPFSVHGEYTPDHSHQALAFL